MMNHDDVNLPWVVAEVTAAFYRYEDALVSNNIAVLDELFWHDKNTVRLGAGKTCTGSMKSAPFVRRALPPGCSERCVIRLSPPSGRIMRCAAPNLPAKGRKDWPPAADVGAFCLRVADCGGAGEFDGVTLKRWRCAYRAYAYTLWFL
jgi:hypothetical protein